MFGASRGRAVALKHRRQRRRRHLPTVLSTTAARVEKQGGMEGAGKYTVRVKMTARQLTGLLPQRRGRQGGGGLGWCRKLVMTYSQPHHGRGRGGVGGLHG